MKKGNGSQGIAWTIHDIKYAVDESSHFFDRKTMKFFHDTMRDFHVSNRNGRTIISRERSNESRSYTAKWEFIAEEGKMKGKIVPYRDHEEEV